MGNQFKFLIKLHQMKFVIAATFAAAGMGEDLERAGWEVSCGLWKSGVAFNKGLTAETANNKTTYKDSAGAEFTAWSGEDGYADSNCSKLDGASYLTAGAAMAVAAAALAPMYSA